MASMASMVGVDGGLGSSTQRALTRKSLCVPSGEDGTHSSSLFFVLNRMQDVSGVCPLLCDSLLHLALTVGQLLVSPFLGPRSVFRHSRVYCDSYSHSSAVLPLT